MAIQNIDAWIPEEQGSDVITEINRMSVLEQFGRPEGMTSRTKSVPRMGESGIEVIAPGGTYTEDTSENDEVILTARKFGRIFAFAEEDLDDSPVATIQAKQLSWGRAYARALDNAAFAVTGAENGTTVPFSSAYLQLNTTAAAGEPEDYTAGDHIVQTAGPLTFDHCSDTLGHYEDSGFFDPANTVVAADPSYRALLRNVKDTENRPILIEAHSNTGQDTLFGFPIQWSLGLKASATFTPNPTGNALLFVTNRELLARGDRSPVESVFIDGRDGARADSDESLLKMRVRKAFALGFRNGAACLEVTPAGP